MLNSELFLFLIEFLATNAVLIALLLLLLFLVLLLAYKVRNLQKESVRNISRVHSKQAEIDRLRDVYGSLTGYTQFGDLPEDIESAIRSAITKSPTKHSSDQDIESLVDDERLINSFSGGDINLFGEVTNSDGRYMLKQCEEMLISLANGDLGIEELPYRSELDVIVKLSLRAEAFSPNSYAAAKLGLIVSMLRYKLAAIGVHLTFVKPLTLVAGEEIVVQYQDIDEFLNDPDIHKILETEYFTLSQGPRRDTHFVIADCQRVGFVSADGVRLPTALVFDRTRYV